MDRHELSAAAWIKSSYSGDNGGNCVEIAPAFPAVVPVRDSKLVNGPVLVVTRSAWSAFTAAHGACLR
ncbi:DUF397 domain-containing protein [Streptomyces sp. NBC_01288]|uniref:DUF397 domain-containing protein n=1 Tax=Streptomyces sp. NBC_01288 TaxID=2903814 RepID=UPI002E156C8F|nr:DUF397 domain-containing protein [Streptomyces sp. NBC_01288]